MSEFTVAELAEKFGLNVDGKDSVSISGVAGLREAQPGEISFLSLKKYRSYMARTRASAVIVSPDFEGACDAVLLRSDNPEEAFSQVSRLFAAPPLTFPPGIHPSAAIADDADIGEACHIGPYCVIGAGAKIGSRSVLAGQVHIGEGAIIGEEALIYSNSCVREHCVIGDRFILHNCSVIGADGFGYSVDESGRRTKIAQIGIVVIGDDVEVGACTTIDRARFGKTRVGHRVKIDNLVQIAHNVVLGDDAVIVSQVGIAGSSVVGSKAILAGKVGVGGHLVIGEGAIVAARSGVTKDIAPKQYVWGYPAEPFEKAMRERKSLHDVPKLKDRIAELEDRIRTLESDRA